MVAAMVQAGLWRRHLRPEVGAEDDHGHPGAHQEGVCPSPCGAQSLPVMLRAPTAAPAKLSLSHRDLVLFKGWGRVDQGLPDLLDAPAPWPSAVLPCTEIVNSRPRASPGVGARRGRACLSRERQGLLPATSTAPRSLPPGWPWPLPTVPGQARYWGQRRRRGCPGRGHRRAAGTARRGRGPALQAALPRSPGGPRGWGRECPESRGGAGPGAGSRGTDRAGLRSGVPRADPRGRCLGEVPRAGRPGPVPGGDPALHSQSLQQRLGWAGQG